MRKLTVLVALLTGLSMTGAALLASIVGKPERPPRMELTSDVEPSASLPFRAVEITDTSERDEHVEEVAESDPVRQEIDPGKQFVDEGEGPVLIVVDKASGLAVPGAEVAYADYGQARARHREEGGPPYAHRAELAERYGAVLVTNAEGRVRLPLMQIRTLVAASHEDKFAGTLLLRKATGEVRLELEPDETLVLRVIDSTGVGREDVPLGVYRGNGRADAKRLWRGNSSTDGFVTLNHFQLLRHGSGSRFAAALRIPAAHPAATEFPAFPLPEGPVTITLPLTGSLHIDVVDTGGKEITAGGRMTLHAVRPEETPFDLPLDTSFEELSATAEAGKGSFVFPFVGLNLELQPSLRLNGDRRPWKPETVAGPTAPDEPLRTKIAIPGDMTLLSGVVVDQDGEPLGQPWIDFQLDAAEGRVARSRCGLTDEGSFEMVVRLADKSPPFALQIRTRPQRQPEENQPITGLRFELNELRAGGRNDLGTLQLVELQVLAHGTVTDDSGEPVVGASVYLQRYHARVPNVRQNPREPRGVHVASEPHLDWHTESLVRSRTDDQGRFELLGKVLSGPLRLRASRSGHMPATSPEINPGAEVDLMLSLAGTLRGEVRVPNWLPRRAVLVRLRPRDNPERGKGARLNTSRANPSEDRRTYRFNRLPPGVYDLELELRGFADPLLQVYGLAMVAGENDPNPQLQGLDLTGLVHRFVLRTHGSDGSKPEGGTIVARHTRPTGEPETAVFPLKGGVAELVTPSRALELTVLARGYRPQQLTALAGDREIYLDPSPTVLLHIPGLRDLVGPDRKVKIVLRNTKPTDLPESLRGFDPSSGRGYSADGSDFGGGSGWLGAGDTASVPLNSPGEYEVSLLPQEEGARPVALGTIPVDPEQGGTVRVPLDRDRVAGEIGPREDR